MQRTDVLTGLSIRLGPALKIYEYHIKVLQQCHFEEDEGDSFMGWGERGHASEGEGENRDSVNATVSAISAFLCLCENKTTLGRARAWTIPGERREAEMTQLSWLPYPGYLVIQKTGFRGLKARFLLSSCLSDPTPSFSLTIVHCLFWGAGERWGNVVFLLFPIFTWAEMIYASAAPKWLLPSLSPTVAFDSPDCPFFLSVIGKKKSLLEVPGGFNQIAFYSLFSSGSLFFQFSWLLPRVNCFLLLFFSSPFFKNINI